MNNSSNVDLKAMRELYLSELDFDLLDKKNQDHSFYKNYEFLLKLNPDSEEFRFILLHNLFGPIQYLEELKKLSAKKYKVWKNRLVKNTDNVGIYGDLFELYITWSLVMKKIQFKSIDSPDFEINHDNSKIFIECTSSQFDHGKTPTKEEILSKLENTVFKKMMSKYANTSTCLFIDITNLCYHAKILNSNITQEELKLSVLNASGKIDNFQSSSTYGAFMFFWINISKDSKDRVMYVSNSFDIIENTNCDSHLMDFLKSNNINIPDKKEIAALKFSH
jgi:hypothetical protein